MIAIPVLILVVFCAGWYYLHKATLENRKSTRSPFGPLGTLIPAKPIVIDQKARDRVLKQKFKPEKVPENLDAIIVGSGIGGLSVAALLAKAGWKVLVLEQHDRAGGCCHTFIEKGFEFDVGLHYVGDCVGNTELRLLLDQLTDGHLQWAPIAYPYDTLTMGNPGEQLYRNIVIPHSPSNFYEEMSNRFPEEEKNIRAILDSMKEIREQRFYIGFLKLLPLSIAKFLITTGIIHWITSLFEFFGQSATEYLQKMTPNKELRAILSYTSGDFGMVPKDVPWALLALSWYHFWGGAGYPIGGASEIPFTIIPVIEHFGGKVLMNAKVKKITVDDHGRVGGVLVESRGKQFAINAPIVVSDAGIINTFSRLLPREIATNSRYSKRMQEIGSGRAGAQLFVGLRGDSDELGLTSANAWVTTDTHMDIDWSYDQFFQTPVSSLTKWPLMFISFPSAKDPTWKLRHPASASILGKSVCIILTLVDANWFKKWENLQVRKRGADYEGLKKELATLLWEHCVKYFPQLDGKVEYIEYGTPLSSQHYINSPNGEFYGINHSMERMSPMCVVDLRPKTDIPGLYLTGQDINVCGIVGAGFGGLLCASALLKRNLFGELENMRKQKERTSVGSSSWIQFHLDKLSLKVQNSVLWGL